MMRISLRAFPTLIASLALCAAPLAHAAQAAADAKPEAPAPAAESFDDQARFIAGLSVSEGSPLAEIETLQSWQDYAKALDGDWAKLKEKRLDAMAEFSAKELAPKVDLKANLFYLFGGPDLISALVLYPDAPVTILAGLEPIGEVPQISALKKAALNRAIGNLHTSIRTTVRASFFRTNEMAADLTRTEFRGVLPLLFLFAARAGFELRDVQYLELTDPGDERVLAEGAKRDKRLTQGVRLTLRKRGGKQDQTVYYLRQNVENTVLKDVPGFLAFFKKHAPANHFFKAASFILHDAKRFSATRDFVMENALSILQDDSGVPFAQLTKARWSTHLYGTYLRPLPPFQRHLQEDLAKAFKDGPVAPLPFVTGYRRPGDANLVLALPEQ